MGGTEQQGDGTKPLVPRSALAGIAWPAMPAPGDALLLALLYQLEQSAHWPAETILAHQLAQIGHLVGHAVETVPYYRRVYGGSAPAIRDLDDVGKLPVLRRTDVQQAGAALVSATVPDGHGEAIRAKSSGSTGRPVELLSTGVTRLMFRALNMRMFLWKGGDKDAPAANITDRLSLDPALARHAAAGGTRPRLAAFETGPTHYLDIRTPVDRQLEWLLGVNPATLTTFPTNLRALLRETERQGRRPDGLREVTTLSEQLDPDLRDQALRIWGARLFDVYSAVECGMLAMQCPEPGHDHYLVQAESALVEVLDETGRPCGPGEVGRVVVTILHNFATPLIRYEVGDYAEVGAPCSAGWGLPVLSRVMGRTRNLLVLPSGGTIWPLFNRILNARDFPELRQFQLVQHSVEAFQLRLAVVRPPGAAGEARLTASLREAIGPHIRVEFDYVDSIPRGPGGKFEDFVSLVARAPDPPEAMPIAHG